MVSGATQGTARGLKRDLTRGLRRGVTGAMTVLAGLIFFGLPGIAAAQNKVYGTLTCSDTTAPSHAPIAAKPGHVLTTMKQNCSWPEALSIGNAQARDTETTFQSDRQGTHGDDSGAYAIHMSNGDQLTMKFSGTSVLDASGGLRSLTGTWSFENGTGTLKGITGSGTYAGLPRAAGGLTYDIEGSYQLPSDIETPPALQPTPSPQSGSGTKSES